MESFLCPLLAMVYHKIYHYFSAFRTSKFFILNSLVTITKVQCRIFSSQPPSYIICLLSSSSLFFRCFGRACQLFIRDILYWLIMQPCISPEVFERYAILYIFDENFQGTVACRNPGYWSSLHLRKCHNRAPCFLLSLLCLIIFFILTEYLLKPPPPRTPTTIIPPLCAALRSRSHKLSGLAHRDEYFSAGCLIKRA